MNWNENADCVSRKLLKEWLPETGSVTRAVSGICNLQILKGAGRAKSAKMPKRSCKSLANSVPEFREGPSERHNAIAEADGIGRLAS
jgi:hypothetical protein